ncbi:MAG: substrate-binding domain-containing protein [Propionibacteriaceae bacterium]|jgi:DNA-binding LacI/PurR family transcriptional regulator|nr:substrate-binding domain-containing protein [Propionibacteriaceae bacterium]
MMTDQRDLPAPRRERLLELLRQRGSARVTDLASWLDVNAVTVRRDLARLESDGLIERTHGGASIPSALSLSQPNLAGAGLMNEGQVAMLAPGLDFYWPEVARGAEARARQLGLRLLLRGHSYESVDERPALAPLFEAEDVRGVIAVPNTKGPHADEVMAWLAAQPVPSVLVEREAQLGPTGEPVESVVTDHALGAAMAVWHLWQLGHRRLGLVVSPTSPTTSKIKVGWQRTCDELAAENAFAVHIPDHRTPGFAAALEEIIDRCDDLGATGLLVHSDREAMGLLQQLESRGRRVPDDISIVAYDDELAGLFTPALTAVRPARQALGAAAVDLLIARFEDPGRPVHRVIISPQLSVRESTAAVV